MINSLNVDNQNNKMMFKWNVLIPMRDGIRLSADLFFPNEDSTLKYPVILMRSPYGYNNTPNLQKAIFFAQHGYVFIFQDVRGRHDSEGIWEPFIHEGADGYDTIEWIIHQLWSNGKVALFGGSYLGWCSWANVREHHPNLITISSACAVGNFFKETPYVNGIPLLGHLQWLFLTHGHTMHWEIQPHISWSKILSKVPLAQMDEFMGFHSDDWVQLFQHQTFDKYWKRLKFSTEDFSSIKIPILHLTGWYDGDQSGALFYYNGMVKYSQAKDQQYLILGPWDHWGVHNPQSKLGQLDFTDQAAMDTLQLILDWFDYWMKGVKNRISTLPKTQIFLMGTNKWIKTNQSFPLLNTKNQIYYLRSGGSANNHHGDGVLSLSLNDHEDYDCIRYDPRNPVITIRNMNEYEEMEKVDLDNRFITQREDVLVYTSEPLTGELTICGEPSIEFYCETDCLDTDWFASLTDVYPTGECITLANNIFRTGGMRARYRKNLEKIELVIPNQVYKISFELECTGITFLPEHQIRLIVTNSAMPTFARNHNTGKDPAIDVDFKIAMNKLHHSKQHPSKLILPVFTSPINEIIPGEGK